jgi:hypothetical protein
MAWAECEECGWELAEPGLGCAIIGETRCTNCEHARPLTLDERVEIGESVDQKIHVLERELDRINPTLK